MGRKGSLQRAGSEEVPRKVCLRVMDVKTGLCSQTEGAVRAGRGGGGRAWQVRRAGLQLRHAQE